MRRIVITGASGFLGSRIAAYYQKMNQVLCPSRREMDIMEEESVRRYIAAYRPEVVIHCAAVSDVGRCEREPERSSLVNVTGSVNMAKACADVGSRCVLCSSDQVYMGSTHPGPHREEEVLNPSNTYGRQKHMAEQLCLEAYPESVLLRLSWMYDSKQGKSGSHSDFLHNFWVDWLAGKCLSYPIYDKRGITDVWEVTRNLEKTFSLPGGCYHFGAGNHISTYDVMQEIWERLGLPEERLFRNELAFAENPRDLTMSQDKCRQCGINFTDTMEGIIQCLSELQQ